jgi:hypothetical protein
VSPKNCTPEMKTVNYLKKNLLYCFETQTRGSLKDLIDKLEDNFFSSGKREPTLDGRKLVPKPETHHGKKRRDKNTA